LNCMLKPCVPFIPSEAFYLLLWPIVMVSAMVLTNWLLINTFKHFSKKNFNKKHQRKKK